MPEVRRTEPLKVSSIYKGLFGITRVPRTSASGEVTPQIKLGAPTILGQPKTAGDAEQIFTSASPTPAPTLTVAANSPRPQVVEGLNSLLSNWARKRVLTNVSTQRNT